MTRRPFAIARVLTLLAVAAVTGDPATTAACTFWALRAWARHLDRTHRPDPARPCSRRPRQEATR